jgi:superfamily II DNA or RNA helicase
VKKGDMVMGPDSFPRLVTSTTKGESDLYKITPVKGDPYIVNDVHILSLKRTAEKRNDPRKGEIVNLSVQDYLKKNTTFKHIHKGWRTGVDFPEIDEPPIEPYFLGLWLGDGNSTSVRITTPDETVKAYLFDYAKRNGHTTSVYDEPSNCETVRIKAGSEIMGKLRQLNLIKNKHIPDVYKLGSKETRLEILAGVLDADGYLHHGHFDIVIKQKEFAEGITFISRSLGLAAYMKQCEKICTNTGARGTYYRVSISGDVDMIPCKLKRRQANERKQIKDVLVTGIKVEYHDYGEYFGFELFGPDRLFLLGDFTVTHNTAIMSDIARTHNEPTIVIAHRQELVGQISQALARNGIYHKVIASNSTVRFCVSQHMREFNRSYFHAKSKVAVAGVQTLIKRHDDLEQWCKSVTLWMIDECHHISKGNSWHTAVEMFPNAKGLGVTATPLRADGKGLGRDSDGVMDEMIVGPSMRDLVERNFLSDYRIIAPPSDLRTEDLKIGSTGDYTAPSMTKAVRESHIVGDVVEQYLKYANGKLGVTFTTDVSTAKEIAAKFRSCNVPAECVSAKTPDTMRAQLIRDFAAGTIKQLVNVDLFGEGFDLPAIEVVSFARPTMSYGLFVQQFGRSLRTLEGKKHAIIIDHVSNTLRHGLPDYGRDWTLDRRERRSKGTPDDVIPTKICDECLMVYERIHRQCPFCQHTPVPIERNSPEVVDGDLFELDAETLARLRGARRKPKPDPDYMIGTGMDKGKAYAISKNWTSRTEAQNELSQSIAWWGAWQRQLGRTDSEAYRRFYLKYGVDVLSAQA